MDHPVDSKTATRKASSELPFTAPWLLAPMDGVTDACFRDLLLDMHTPGHLGGAFTEFVRIHQGVPSRAHFEEHLGPNRFPIPVGLQFMGRGLEDLRDAAAFVADLGVPVLDLNFGCPARGARKGCVGAALLDFPEDIGPIIDACVEGAAGRMPVTAKIRSGVRDDTRLEDIVRAVDNSGAAMLTIHCRTKQEGYDEDAIDWHRIERARAATSKPLCGNGGIETLEEAERMRRETGCEYVMIGRAALANPWVFSGHTASDSESFVFMQRYAAMMQERGALPRQALARLKQVVRYWSVGTLICDEEFRRECLRISELDTLLDTLEERS